MAEHGLFIGWGAPRAGKEAAAAKNFEECVAYCTTLKAAGDIEGFEVVVLTPHGGDLGGFFLVRGDPEKLGRLSMAPEFQRLLYRAGFCSEGVGVFSAVVDAGVMPWLGAWKEAIADLI